MPLVSGVIVHHSACSSINGKGYDFMVLDGGMVIAAAERADSDYIHICLSGNFNCPWEFLTVGQKEQLFVAGRLILRLAKSCGFGPDDVFPHRLDCPGPRFPWGKLVISPEDLYH